MLRRRTHKIFLTVSAVLAGIEVPFLAAGIIEPTVPHWFLVPFFMLWWACGMWVATKLSVRFLIRDTTFLKRTRQKSMWVLFISEEIEEAAR